MFPITPQTIASEPVLCINCENIVVDPKTRTLCCAWFGHLNVITGKKEYMACSVVRQDPEKCGIEGNYFCHKYYVPVHETDESPHDSSS